LFNFPNLLNKLDELKISVKDATTGELRSFDDILKDIAGKWNTWNTETQSSVAKVIGMKYHYSKFIALMENFNIATDATNTAMYSFNSAIEENAKQIDSITGRWQKFKNEVESFWNSIIGSDAIKILVTGLEKLTDTLNRGVKGTRQWYDILIQALVPPGSSIWFETALHGLIDKEDIESTKKYTQAISDLRTSVQKGLAKDSPEIQTFINRFKEMGLSSEKTQ